MTNLSFLSLSFGHTSHLTRSSNDCVRVRERKEEEKKPITQRVDNSTKIFEHCLDHVFIGRLR